MKSIIIILLGLFTQVSYAQLVSWNFAGPAPTNGREASIAPTFVKEGLTAGDLAKGPFIKTKQASLRGFGGHLAKNVATYEEAVKQNAYFEFYVTVDKGYTASLSTLKAKLRIQEFSAKNFQWAYSIDGKDFVLAHKEAFALSNLTNNGVNQPNIDLTTIKELQQIKANKKVVFRLYVWGNNNSQDKGKISVGFGKSDVKTNNAALELDGSVTKK